MRIMTKSLRISDRWSKQLQELPETGMGYQVCNVELKNGQIYSGVVVTNCEVVTRVAGENGVPFSEGDISKITVTHDKTAVV